MIKLKLKLELRFSGLWFMSFGLLKLIFVGLWFSFVGFWLRRIMCFIL